MDTSPIFISPLSDASAHCQSVSGALETYWTAPDKFSIQSIGIIQQHLQSCTTCQEQMQHIVAATKPPWEQQKSSA